MTFHDNCGPVSLGFQPGSGNYATGMTTLDYMLVSNVKHVKDNKARWRVSPFCCIFYRSRHSMLEHLWPAKWISNMTQPRRRRPGFLLPPNEKMLIAIIHKALVVITVHTCVSVFPLCFLITAFASFMSICIPSSSPTHISIYLETLIYLNTLLSIYSYTLLL